MVAPRTQKSLKPLGPAVTPTAAEDFLNILARQNPGLSKSALKTTGRALAALSAAAGRLSREQQRRMVAHASDLTTAMERLVSEIASGETAAKLIEVDRDVPVEDSLGQGLGEVLSVREGAQRVFDYSTPVRLEDWAGPVAGPGEIERAYGIRRSTLHDWRKRGAIVGLLKGERKHVFPLAQFVDGRPIEGMAKVTAIIGNPRAAWLWLTRSHPTADHSSPLDRLKHGRVNDVVAAAERDFR